MAPIAAGAALFLGGYGAGLSTSNMYTDIQVAEQRRESEALVAPKLPATQVSLTMPDKVGCN
jgi:hypothetical protein